MPKYEFLKAKSQMANNSSSGAIGMVAEPHGR